ncbi:ribonuclease H1 [Anopheles aquasalis]|uniref:ribonuclease H1 n=1 Tax=Anopheles aquasalis TaxID=42839 RepID=UPI00215B346F|nr:ribonuclease H1 [Anopheles aquasalis]
MFVRRWIAVLPQIMPFYAVAKGRAVGIYKTWPECEAQVKGFTGARYKKFSTQTEATEFIREFGGGGSLASVRQFSTSTTKRSLPPFEDSGTAGQPLNKKQRKAILRESKPKPVLKMARYGKHSFQQDQDGYVHVYTDGSCEGNGQPNAAAGLGVYFDEGHALNTSKPVSGRATNNCGEIQAASEAIRRAREQGVERLAINTDSKFLIDATTQWMPGWKQRGWTLASGGPVKNKADFMELDREMNTGNMSIKFNHVDAHSGIVGNERADQLARKGSEMYRAERRNTGNRR